MFTTTQNHPQQTFMTTAIDSLSSTLNMVTNPSQSTPVSQVLNMPNNGQWILLITPKRMPLKSLLKDKVESLSRIFAISEDQIADMPSFLDKVLQSNNFSTIIKLEDRLTVATETEASATSFNQISFYNTRKQPAIPKRALA